MLLLTLFLIYVAAVQIQARCPPVDVISPCICRTHVERDANYDILSCYNLQSEKELLRALAATEGFRLFELELVNCALSFLPHEAFLNTTFEIISVRNSSIIGLSDSGLVLNGLNSTLRLIEIINCSYASFWDWTRLSHLQRLEEIHVSDSQMIDITKGISGIKHLEIDAFVFQKNNILEIHDDTFAPFVSLERLALDNNYISEIKRSMLPSPVANLKILGLSFNKLKDLPEDLFQNMPFLKSLYLTGNPLYTIEERVFRPIWRQLHLFLFDATRVSCDCGLAWLTKEDNRDKFFHGECQRPMRFKGRMLESIRIEELWCDGFQ